MTEALLPQLLHILFGMARQAYILLKNYRRGVIKLRHHLAAVVALCTVIRPAHLDFYMWTPIIFGFGTGFVMSISLGAVFFLLIQAGLAGGWRKGLPLALGVIVGDLIYVTLSLHFSEAITETLVHYRGDIAKLGGVVFWILAITHIFHHHKAKKKGLDERLLQMKDWQLWLKSFAINVLNPVNIAWWLSLYSLPPAADFSYSGKWIFGIAALATVLFTELGVAWGAGKIKGYLTEERIRQIDLFLALLFFGMGIYLFTV